MRKKRIIRWLKRLAAAVALSGVVLVLLAATGALDGWVRSLVVRRIERMSGGRAEMKTFRFHWLSLRAELDGLTVHGREPEGTPPMFYAEHIGLKARVISLWSRRVALDELVLERPSVHLRVDAEGHSNFAGPKTPPSGPAQPLAERLLDVQIGKLRLNAGELLLNDVRVPLAAEGGDLRLAVDFHGAASRAKESYSGEWEWKQLRLAARRYLPFGSEARMKFTVTRDSLRVDEFAWRLPHSSLQASAALASFARPDWMMNYQATISLADIRGILRKPHSPGGTVEVSGEGKLAAGELSLRGKCEAREITLPYEWFHAERLSGRGSYTLEKGRVILPDFQATALGGETTAWVEMELAGAKFRAETHSRSMSLAAILAAVDHENFPVNALHWQGAVDVDAVSTWSAEFKHFASRGTSAWRKPAQEQAGGIPAAAQVDFDYSLDRRGVELGPSQISTPSSRLQFHGPLGMADSALAVKLEARDLLDWDDFINALRGVGPKSDAAPRRIAGSATWDGRLTGHLDAPEFRGHARVKNAEYDELRWDELEGDLTYSPEQLRLEAMRARRGSSTAALKLWLDLYDWRFRPENPWSLDAQMVREDPQGLQEFFGWNYPVSGIVSGTFHGEGTRRDPAYAGQLEATEVQVWGWTADRVRGEIQIRGGELQMSNAEIRKNGGRVTGNFLYRAATQEVKFDAQATAVRLESIERLQGGKFSIAGELSGQISGRGAMGAPFSQGTLRLGNLRVGKDVLGSLEGRLQSDGRKLHADLRSDMSGRQIRGNLDVTLGGEYPVAGDVTVAGVGLDFLIQTAFHIEQLSGHSRADGRFRVMGALARPQTLVVEADISRLSLDYQFLKLENEGPLRFTYRAEEVRIEEAHIRGPETDVRVSGFARFTGDRPLNLKTSGTVNLRLLRGFWPQLDARGAAQVNALVEGTFRAPRINGKVHTENAAANYAEMPAGLSEVTGDFVFDASRLVFQNVQATVGGGRLLLSGTMNYSDGPFRYDISGQASKVRVRYPEGMGWLGGGTLRLSGTARAAVLGGRLVVERVLMSQGFEFSGLIAASGGTLRAPATASLFLRNLQFDIEAASSPDARMEWSGARFETEAGLRVRGTWEHPILLGHIHLLAGEMMFRGNRYRLTRGDINFSKPFRLDPDLSVEVTTTIRQYDVTLNFTGQASKLNLAYRSDPPLPSGDIIALLALGRTGEESELRTSAQGQFGEAGANALLSEAISSQLGGRIERLFGVSRFRVDPFLAGTGTEQNASARITIEQQLTRDLVVTYITNVSSTQHQVIQVEYSVNRDVSIVALRDQNGTFGLDFKFKKRFK